MTKLGYRLLMATFALLAAGGAWLAAPRGHELGLGPELDCRAFVADPSEQEYVRLGGCALEVEAGQAAWVADPGGAVLWVDPSLPAVSDAVGEGAAPGAARDLAGSVEAVPRYASVSHTGNDWVMRERSGSADARRRIWGLLILLPSLLLALLLLRAQRRWTRREEALRGDAAPLTF